MVLMVLILLTTTHGIEIIDHGMHGIEIIDHATHGIEIIENCNVRGTGKGGT